MKWSHIFSSLHRCSSLGGVNVYLDLKSHQKHGIHCSLAAAGLNEACPFLPETPEPQVLGPRGEGQETKKEQSIAHHWWWKNEKFIFLHFRHSLGMKKRSVFRKTKKYSLWGGTFEFMGNLLSCSGVPPTRHLSVPVTLRQRDEFVFKGKKTKIIFSIWKLNTKVISFCPFFRVPYCLI